jgi:ABC-type antimicrobial peptide transport system permease subunit
VGVVKDISTLASKQVDEAMIYRPFTPTEGNQGAWPWRIVIHVNGDAAALGTPLRRATVAADAALRLEDVLTMDRVAEADALAMNFFVRSLGIVSALALLLSIAGIYSLISFTLARRTREIGIRIALGAAPHRIVTGVLSKALYQIGFGVLVGAVPGVTILAIGLEDDTGGTTLVQAIALTLGMAALVLGIAAVSCAVPLRRALRVEPTQALRAE